MHRQSGYIQNVISEAASSLLARATDPRSLDANQLTPRIERVVQKYLLRDEEQASAEAISSFVEGLQVDDLCLVIACERGDQSAWEDLVSRFSATVRSAARSATSSEDAAEDLSQSIWAELHGLRTRDGMPAGKLSYYSGRGSLAGWLRAVVAQLAIDQHRKQSRLVQTEDDAQFDRLVKDDDEHNEQLRGLSPDPEAAVTNKFAGQEINEALMRAIKELPDEDRLLVKLYYFDELKLREAGAVLGVHEATASRRLARIHGDLRSKVYRLLVEERGWTKAEAEKSFAEVALNLDTDFEPLLASGAMLDERAGSGQ